MNSFRNGLALAALAALLCAPGAALGAPSGLGTTQSGQLAAGGYFSGACTFEGGGLAGFCSITVNFRTPASFTCLERVTVTAWSERPMAAGQPVGIWIDAGTVNASAPTAQASAYCATQTTPSGTLGAGGAIVKPIDTRVPAAPGTYHFSQFGQLKAAATVNVTAG